MVLKLFGWIWLPPAARMFLLKPAMERYMERFPHEVEDPLEIGHWSVLKSVKELLEAVKLASLKLESEQHRTAGRTWGSSTSSLNTYTTKRTASSA